MQGILFFHFDGTGNEPEDAQQETKGLKNEIEDNSITNVLKLHLLLGGTLQQERGETDLGDDCISFYYRGIGTYGNKLQKMLALGLATGDVAHILTSATKDFKKVFKRDVHKAVVLTGFSRGAALARRFAQVLINEKCLTEQDKIITELVFDTVASIGLPNTVQDQRPKSEVVFEHGFSLPPNVKRALHLVSLDDKRDIFQPTLMNTEKRVEEIWFPGAHSDVGGGYNFDGLSDQTLCFAKDWLESIDELDVQLKPPARVEVDRLFKDGEPQLIGQDDLLVDPTPFGVIHQQQYRFYTDFLYNHRRCVVIEGDRVRPNLAPKVHVSVAQRIAAKREYRPESLKRIDHQLVFAPAHVHPNLCTGIAPHELGFYSNLLLAEDELEVRVVAHRKNNHSGVLVEKGQRYLVKMVGSKRWNDSHIREVDGEGWTREGQSFRWYKNIAISSMEHKRRVPDADWFALCFNVDEDDDCAEYIGNEKIIAPHQTGELCLFANDLNSYYGNNSGFLEVSIKKL